MLLNGNITFICSCFLFRLHSFQISLLFYHCYRITFHEYFPLISLEILFELSHFFSYSFRGLPSTSLPINSSPSTIKWGRDRQKNLLSLLLGYQSLAIAIKMNIASKINNIIGTMFFDCRLLLLFVSASTDHGPCPRTFIRLTLTSSPISSVSHSEFFAFIIIAKAMMILCAISGNHLSCAIWVEYKDVGFTIVCSSENTI